MQACMEFKRHGWYIESLTTIDRLAMSCCDYRVFAMLICTTTTFRMTALCHLRPIYSGCLFYWLLKTHYFLGGVVELWIQFLFLIISQQNIATVVELYKHSKQLISLKMHSTVIVLFILHPLADQNETKTQKLLIRSRRLGSSLILVHLFQKEYMVSKYSL